MNIVEATRKALNEKKYIYNKNCPDVKLDPDLLMPFDIMRTDGSERVHCWNPTGEDILSEEWEIFD